MGAGFCTLNRKIHYVKARFIILSFECKYLWYYREVYGFSSLSSKKCRLSAEMGGGAEMHFFVKMVGR